MAKKNTAAAVATPIPGVPKAKKPVPAAVAEAAKAKKPVAVKSAETPEQFKARKDAEKAAKAEGGDKTVARSEFNPNAKIELLVPLEQIIAKRRGNPAQLYALLEDGMTVQAFMDLIRPLKGTLAEVRKALHNKEISVEGIDATQYEVIHGTACTPCGPTGSAKPEVKPRGPKAEATEDESEDEEEDEDEE